MRALMAAFMLGAVFVILCPPGVFMRCSMRVAYAPQFRLSTKIVRLTTEILLRIKSVVHIRYMGYRADMKHREIIQKFGGIRPMQIALGHTNPTTVQAWHKRDHIPHWRTHEVLIAARKQRLGLKESDFHESSP